MSADLSVGSGGPGGSGGVGTAGKDGKDATGVTVRVPLATQLFRFVCTGVVGAVVDFGSTYLLHLAGLSDGLSKTVGFVLGTLTAYFINRRWTFQADPSTRRFVVTMLSYLVTYVVQLGLYKLCIPWLEDHDFSDFWTRAVSFVIAQGTATVLNFIIQRWVIFRVL
ncbi:GtrA family protein [Corynebacterium neomassiliense]|uniref:GtrA family protein n=1 Tax=Corynebacterium neomassiliense TaxID=2079482 RepID=UPI0023517493|nr:GtrA family protein [Corynebacterium neomassiliense]